LISPPLAASIRPAEVRLCQQLQTLATGERRKNNKLSVGFSTATEVHLWQRLQDLPTGGRKNNKLSARFLTVAEVCLWQRLQDLPTGERKNNKLSANFSSVAEVCRSLHFSKK
jgi:hypothetical protein